MSLGDKIKQLKDGPEKSVIGSIIDILNAIGASPSGSDVVFDRLSGAYIFKVNGIEVFRIENSILVQGHAQFQQSTSPASPPGQGRIKFDLATLKFMISEDGGAYVPLGGGGGGIGAPIFSSGGFIGFPPFGPPFTGPFVVEVGADPGGGVPSGLPPGLQAFPAPIFRIPMYGTYTFSWISARVLPGTPPFPVVPLNAPLILTALKNGVDTALTLTYLPSGSGLMSLTGTPVIFSPGDALTFKFNATGATLGASQFSVLIG